MAAQLRRAPWLALSLALHGLIVLVLLLIPREEPDADSAPQVRLAPTEQAPVIDEIPPEPEPEPDIPPVVFDDVPIEEPISDVIEKSDIVSDVENVADAESAFDWTGPNPAIGIGGDAGGKYAGRPGGGRRGRRSPTYDTTHAALEWLARHQDDDGSWDADEFMKHDVEGTACDGAGNPAHDVGVTGLALLAFLGDGHTMYGAGEYADNVHAAVKWLTTQQDPDSGLLGTASSNEFVYDHAIATLALVEASGLSRSRVLRPYAQRALNYLEYHRNPYGVWRYQPRDGDADTSVTGWCVLAYKAGQDFDFQVNVQALEFAAAFLDQMTDPATGRTGYSQRGGSSSRLTGDHAERFPREQNECMSAVSLLCRIFMGGIDAKDPLVEKQAQLVLAKPPRWDEEAGTIDHYAWYYGTYALYQVGQSPWRQWQKSLHRAVVKTQRNDANFRGSWDPRGVWGSTGGRVYSTAILCLTLQAYHRYARVLIR
ncbi:MAG: terpene cyclase/mutase family protein [Planctomycetes bacterium]|nr:terpene cyclase/mutase family protein [Planctomycetota bacterium]